MYCNTVTCSHPLLFNFIRWHHASGWEQLIYATHPIMVCGYIYFSSWCAFINIMFCPCYLFLLWNVLLTCLAFCLTTVIAACFLHLCTCLTRSSAHASSLHPLLAHHHLCYVDVYCVSWLTFFRVCHVAFFIYGC